MGEHPTVTRLLKGVFHDRPPLPRYSSTWNMQLVLDFLGALGKNEDLTLKHLTLKTVIGWLTFLVWETEGVAFLPRSLAKQSRQRKPITEFFFPSLSEDAKVCPVHTLRAYEEKTGSLKA